MPRLPRADVTFDSATSYKTQLSKTGQGSWPTGIATGKLNKDSLVDLVTANEHLPQQHGGVSVFVGSGLLNPPFNVPPFNFDSDPDDPPKPRRVTVGDVNNDGMDDIVTSNYYGGTVSVLIQTGPPPG